MLRTLPFSVAVFVVGCTAPERPAPTTKTETKTEGKEDPAKDPVPTELPPPAAPAAAQEGDTPETLCRAMAEKFGDPAMRGTETWDARMKQCIAKSTQTRKDKPREFEMMVTCVKRSVDNASFQECILTEMTTKR